jgi:PTS system nitrogen regulatory IIA component
MDFEQILSVSCIGLNEDLHDSREVLARIAGLACASPALDGLHSSWVLQSLSAREELGSTALGNGVALPHCRLQGASGFAGGFLTTSREVEFGGGDRRGTRIFGFVVGAADKPAEHLRHLAFLAGFLRRDESRKALLSVSSPEQVPAILASYRERASREGLPRIGTGLRMLHVFTRSREAFEHAMSALASGNHGIALIIEAESEESFSASVPLFAGFRYPGGEKYQRLIITVVHEELVNQILRSLDFACCEDAAGKILVTVSPVQEALGVLPGEIVNSG